MLCACEVYSEERRDGKYHRNRYVAREVGPSREERDDPDEVVEEDEQEGRAEVRRILAVVLLADILPRHRMDHHNERLHQRSDPARTLVQHVVLAVPPRGEKHQQRQQDARKNKRKDIFRNRNVQRPHRAFRCQLDDFALLSDYESFIDRPVGEFMGGETVPAGRPAPHDHRQRQLHRPLRRVEEMPLVGIPDVPEDDLSDVEILFLSRGVKRGEKSNEYEKNPFHASTAAITLLSPTRTKPVRMGRDSSPSSVL